MPRLIFTDNIQRHVACPPADVVGATVGAALTAYFAQYPQARAYILDDQGALRRHMAIYVDGVLITDRARLSDVVKPESQIGIFQALSGG
jgi:sulfur-carrier protein